MDRRDISRVLLGSVAGSVLAGERASAQSCAAPGHAQTAQELAAHVAPKNTTYAPGDIRRYGAIGGDSVDKATATQNGIAIQEAIRAAEIDGGAVFVPEGIYRYGSVLTFSVQHKGVIFRGASVEGSILRKTFNGTGMQVTGAARPLLENFTIDTVGKPTGVGILIDTSAGQTTLRGVRSMRHGSHGIAITQGNLATLQDVLVLYNRGDGLYMHGATTPDVNVIVLSNIDARGNTGWGVNLDSAWANFGTGITAQSNTAGGVRLNNARQNSLHVYSESNTGPGIEFANNAECKGNFLVVLEGEVTFGGTTADRNTVLHTKRGAAFDPNFSKVTANKFILQNLQQGGTEVIGVLTHDHKAANRYDVTASGGGAVALYYFNCTDGVMNVATDGQFYLGNPAEVATSEAQTWLRGSGSPEGVIRAPVGSLYSRIDGGAGTALYVKETGAGKSTGWVAK